MNYLKHKALLFSVCIIAFANSYAEEGMWLPIFLKQMNEQAMIKGGLKIPVEKIYSVNQSSLKDAVVLFGAGCTGEIISDKGLLLTNHHCGMSSIQSQSSVEHDYLTNGYWAMTPEEELYIPTLTVTFVIRVDDVSADINKELSDTMSEEDRENKIKSLSFLLESKATEGTHYTAKVKPYFNGNRFFLTVMETFKDIRLVGAPPNAIGDFGGDTDNWMYPRHTADFSVFRIYAGKDNKPAAYSKDNVPYTPRYHFTISLKGVKEGDFTMVYGFPGTTQEYLPSYAVDIIEKNIDPNRIKIRKARLSIMRSAMQASDTVRIQYADKERRLNNYYKKWQGELVGLKRLKTVARKKEFEKSFSDWSLKKNNLTHKNLLPEFEKAYSEFRRFSVAKDYYTEAVMGIEVISFAKNFISLAEMSVAKNADQKELTSAVEKLKTGSIGFFKNYDARIDKRVFAALLQLYVEDVDAALKSDVLKKVKSKYQNDFNRFANEVFEHSIFVSQEKLNLVLTNYTPQSVKKINEDPAYVLMKNFLDGQKNVDSMYDALSFKLKKMNRIYMQAQMEMQPDKNFYPDANLTMRVTYGNVKGYEPRDGVEYKYFTTLDGLMEKEDSTEEDFVVPSKLKELYALKDYGPYGVSGTLPVNFIATNHTTGGNSGSPVINAYGELIGTNFDRAWEGVMSDLQYDPDQCRNISLDIRYTLFLIEKYAGCKRLIEEMTFAN